MKKLLKPYIKNTRLWPILKFALPKYHRRMLRLGLAEVGIRLRPGAPAAKSLAEAYAEIARVHLYSDYLDDAISSCNKAISHDPLCAPAYIHRSDALRRQGKTLAAAAALKGVRALRSDRAEVHIELADAFLRQCDVVEAIAQYEAARRLQPGIRWPLGDGLVSGEPLQIGTSLVAYFERQPEAAKKRTLVESATKLLEEALRREETLGTLEALQSCYSWAGRYKDFSRVFARYFSLLEQRPAARACEQSDPPVEFLPDVCARGIGATGYLITYIKKKLLLGTRERLVLCAPPDQVVNPSFLSYFKPHLEVLETPEEIAAVSEKMTTASLPLAMGLRFDGPPKYIPLIMGEVTRRWSDENRPPLLSLRETDRRRGREAVEKLGLGLDDWWVTLHVRTPTYYKEGTRSPDRHRSADIRDFFPAIKLITERGGHVFRMGDPSMPPLPKMDRVFDYAHSEIRSDWMDVFLCASSRFYVGTNSGLLLVPNAFGVPGLGTNSLPLVLSPVFPPQDVFLPNVLRRKSGQLLTFREMLEEPYVFGLVQALYDWTEVEVVPNSADELRGAVAEMLENSGLSGNRPQPPMTELQRRFNALAEEAGLRISGRVSHDFLERHRDLLESEPICRH